MQDTLVPIALFAMVPAIIWAVSHYRYKAKEKSAEVVKAMIAKDVEVTPEVIKSIGFVPKRSHVDLRNGMILVAVGIAFLLFGGAIQDEEGQAAMSGLAMFPTLIGIALLIFWYAISRKDAD